MTQTEAWTIQRLLQWTTEHFTAKGFESARLEAEVLLAEALGCARIELYTKFETIPDESALAKFRDWVKRHAKGEPVAYLVGYKEFYSLKFKVDSNVLIPRPETEHLILKAVDVAANIEGLCEVLDVGTGSGCIAVTLAKQIANSSVVATDISEGALAVALENAKHHQVADRIDFKAGDLFSPIEPEKKFDLILSNPPYIGEKEEGTVDEFVRQYEPAIALFSGDEGLNMISRLVAEAPGFLKPGGYLIFETSPIIFEECLSFVSSVNKFEELESIKDYSGHRRLICAKLSA